MRFALFVACCALGVSVASLAQPVSSPERPLSATPTAIIEPASVPSIAQPLPQDSVTPAAAPTAQAIEAQAAANPSDAEAAAQQHAALPGAAPEEQTTGAVAPAASTSEEKNSAPVVEQHAALPAGPAVEPAPVQPEAETKETPADSTATADRCPGHPGALGTSRVLTISPSEFSLLGSLQYKQTLPLKDHEVVLTFDDGPIPPYTTSILDTLASQCVKATYFLVGEMAQIRPSLVRRIYNEGHSIGTHSQHHPYAFQRLPMQRVESEVDGGIASVETALGDPRALSPFFRIPGFGRNGAIEQFLESKKLVTWSTDVDTDDWWRGSSPNAIVQRAMQRLSKKGRGIILMHDIHPATAMALPMLLKELKAEGYHVVHVVAAGDHPQSLPDLIASPAEKEIFPLHAASVGKSAAKSSLRHRVKTALSKRQHRAAKRKGKGTLTTSALDSRRKSY
jgi:peptidoglycan/xylan/chitin deacetylase (PgdA/CDA1 family)